MTGWQRFFLLFLACIAILICWPQYDTKGLTFMAMAFVLFPVGKQANARHPRTGRTMAYLT